MPKVDATATHGPGLRRTQEVPALPANGINGSLQAEKVPGAHQSPSRAEKSTSSRTASASSETPLKSGVHQRTQSTPEKATSTETSSPVQAAASVLSKSDPTAGAFVLTAEAPGPIVVHI